MGKSKRRRQHTRAAVHGTEIDEQRTYFRTGHHRRGLPQPPADWHGGKTNI